MDKQIIKHLGLRLWSIYEVVDIRILQSGRKYPRQAKWVNCKQKDGKPIRFLWYEVEIIE